MAARALPKHSALESSRLCNQEAGGRDRAEEEAMPAAPWPTQGLPAGGSRGTGEAGR